MSQTRMANGHAAVTNCWGWTQVNMSAWLEGMSSNNNCTVRSAQQA